MINNQISQMYSISNHTACNMLVLCKIYSITFNSANGFCMIAGAQPNFSTHTWPQGLAQTGVRSVNYGMWDTHPLIRERCI